jgi:hypothetical protein
MPDDTVILSESESDLQAQLDAFHEYCLTWKLKVNIDKTKIVIFGSGRTPQNLSFFPQIIFVQKKIILMLMSISTGYLPNSPYII